jgi:prepilin-type N-terminal cleavage/methylation domain-containing protein
MRTRHYLKTPSRARRLALFCPGRDGETGPSVRSGPEGFTLIELLVVIAIIAVLMGILMPALRLARLQAGTSRCLSNVKNLSLGWYMYMGENDGRIMSSEDNARLKGTFVGWIGIPRDATGRLLGISQATPEVTDADEIRGIKAGVLFPYLENPAAYHCPSSFVTSLYDQSRVYVSYSIPMCLYGRTARGGANYNEQIRYFSQIKSPSTSYCFVESGETRNWNAAHHFVMAAPEYTNLPDWGWWGPMAVNHGNSSVLGFVDGHAEVRKWRDSYTIERVDKLLNSGASAYGRDFPPPEQHLDIDYMAQGWAYRHPLGR